MKLFFAFASLVCLLYACKPEKKVSPPMAATHQHLIKVYYGTKGTGSRVDSLLDSTVFNDSINKTKRTVFYFKNTDTEGKVKGNFYYVVHDSTPWTVRPGWKAIDTLLVANNDSMGLYNEVLDESGTFLMAPVGKGNYGCCNKFVMIKDGKGKSYLDYFTINEEKYLQLLLAKHKHGNDVIDTLVYHDFKIADTSYNKLNDSLKKYPYLTAGLDKPTDNLKIFFAKETDPLKPLMTIVRKK